MSDEKQELIWVSKELAEKYAQAESDQAKEKIVLDIIQKKKMDFQSEMEMLEEDALRFKGVCAVHKRKLQEIYIEQGNLLEKLWDDMGDVDSQIKQHASKLAEQLNPIEKQVAGISKEVIRLNELLESLGVYGMKNLIDLVSRLQTMDTSTKSILKFLLEEYKPKG